MNGGAEEDRTPDLRIANATLSQLSYRPKSSKTETIQENSRAVQNAGNSYSKDSVAITGAWSEAVRCGAVPCRCRRPRSA